MAQKNDKKVKDKTKLREAERFDFCAKVTYRIKGGKNKFVTFCKDISGKGFRLNTKNLLITGEKIELSLCSKDFGPKAFTFLCRVAWSKEIRPGEFEAGLCFVKIKDKEEFIKQLCEKMLSLSC